MEAWGVVYDSRYYSVDEGAGSQTKETLCQTLLFNYPFRAIENYKCQIEAQDDEPRYSKHLLDVIS